MNTLLLVILLVFLCSIRAEELQQQRDRINVGITFTKITRNEKLKEKFKVCVSSMLKHARKADINLHIVGDPESHQYARHLLSKIYFNQVNVTLVPVDADEMAQKMHQLISKMQSHFSHSPSSYYGDSLFFLSIGMFKIFDPSVSRFILLDADLKFKSDIADLYSLFDKFNESNVMGIARDGQPVYRHSFWKYRNENPNTRVGEPPPHGLTGFNSGVLLLDLEKMRNSKLYESLVTPEAVERLTKKYHFRGHLGDQDFFTLIGNEHEELFYVLPCTWNRQLCTWWAKHGYADVLDLYYRCEGKINIYHGNCDTPIPKDDDDLEYDRIAVKTGADRVDL